MMKFHVLSASAAGAASLVASAPAQTLLVPHNSQNGGRHIAAVSAVDGRLLSASFIDLNFAGAPADRNYQIVETNGHWWVTDDVSETAHVWDATGTTYLSDELSGFDDLYGGTNAFGSSWFCSGSPGGFGLNELVQVTGSNVTSFQATRQPFGIVEFQGELVYTFSQGLMRVDPATGTELGVIFSVGSQGGFGQPTIRSSTGNFLIARQAGHQDIIEVTPSGTLVNEFEVASVLGIGLMLSAYELQNGDFLISTGTGLYVIDPGLSTSEQILDGVRCYYITEAQDVSVGAPYCGPAVPNSTGRSAAIGATGSPFAADNALRIAAHDLPLGSTALYLVSPTQAFIVGAGGSEGDLCLGVPTGRYNSLVTSSTSVGFVDNRIDLLRTPQANGVVPVLAGETWNWQVWYRDVVAGMATSNFSNGASVTFQ